MAFEREAVGFYLSGHPLDRYVEDAKKLGATPTIDLMGARHNSEVQCVGIVASMKERKMKTGDGRWAVITLEDTFGQAEVLCFSRVYAVAEPILKSGAPVFVKGRVLIDDVDDDGKQLVPKMRAESVELLSEAQMRRTRWLDVTVEVAAKAGGTAAADDADPSTLALLEKLASLCAVHPGQVPARLILLMPGGYKVIVQTGDGKRVLPTDALITSIERLKGVVSVART